MSEEIKKENELDTELKNQIAEVVKNAATETVNEVKKSLEVVRTKLPDVNDDVITVNNSPMLKREKMNQKFMEFLKSVPALREKSGVSIPIPPQYIPEIVPIAGQYGLVDQCRYQGRLDSNVMYISRTVSGGNANYMSATGGGTNATGIAAQLSITGLRAMIATIPKRYRNSNLKWYCDLSEEQLIAGVADPYVKVDVQNGITKMLGYEIYPLDNGVLTGTGNSAS